MIYPIQNIIFVHRVTDTKLFVVLFVDRNVYPKMEVALESLISTVWNIILVHIIHSVEIGASLILSI